MNADLVAAARPLLPLRVQTVEYNDPMVVIAGPGWSLSIACPWRLTRAGLLICAYGDENAASRMARLVGHDVTEVGPQGRHEVSRDPALALTDGYLLEVFSDTDLDPWVMRLPEQTFVGAISA